MYKFTGFLRCFIKDIITLFWIMFFAMCLAISTYGYGEAIIALNPELAEENKFLMEYMRIAKPIITPIIDAIINSINFVSDYLASFGK